ncbi:Putrescine transporter PotE [Methanosarcinaceae archaeon Ag5]|uniref:Putrescine transporter PotE n=1 Tax=Methanolapillus africanus TaxID=3028297 RepID=A0AAE4MJH1_9EURY|nr:Putrescine transporter PotE [Methanosarcinaceae archaeon Ag5]
MDSDSNTLQRTIDWKQGLAIALGVPLLILPSIGTFATYLWAFAIVAWALSVLQGFLQNMAYGEMATAFPNASGLPGFAQAVFGAGTSTGKFIGGFSAWGYWLAWNPVLAIFSVLIGSYLNGLVPAFAGISPMWLSLGSGIIIFGVLMLVNSRGVSGGATLGYILAIFALIPLLIITIAPFFTGAFHIENITSSWFPTDWSWDIYGILIFLGIMATAQWSACAWETAAIYGPEYKNPKKDVPKALFSCGIICLFTYVMVQTSVTGTLGVDAVIAERVSPLLPMAKMVLGDMGGIVAIVMLIAAMVLIIQTAFNGSARSMHSLAVEGNLPSFFGKLNKNGVPMVAMAVIAVFNLFLIVLFSMADGGAGPAAILSASAIGYVVANGISLAAYYKAATDPKFKDLERPFKAPKGWKYVAMLFAVVNIPFYLVGIVYLNRLDAGWGPTLLGFVVLALFIPLWWWAQKEAQKKASA